MCQAAILDFEFRVGQESVTLEVFQFRAQINSSKLVFTKQLILVFIFLCPGVDADFAERPPYSGDGCNGQGNGEEVWQVIQENAVFVFTKRSWKKVRSSQTLCISIRCSGCVPNVTKSSLSQCDSGQLLQNCSSTSSLQKPRWATQS